MDEFLDGPITAMAAAIQSREIKSTELVRRFLDRIEKVNPQLNAVVYSNAEQALKNASKADAELAAGTLHGPLHGIPITIKDSLDTKDAVTTWGTLGRKDFTPGRDATCVARLRSAGAIIMGKTNTPEFTLAFHTDNLVYGATRNPWNLDRTPGGSSGGAAAIIAAGASPLDVGTDTGGSIRLPGHFCGIAGIKPTTGRVPCTGNALPSSGLIAPLSQPGPMSRFVEDLMLTLPIMSGPDLIDPHSVQGFWQDPAETDVESLKIGYHADNGIKTPDPAIVSTVTAVADRLKAAGFETGEARPSGIEMAGLLFSRVFTADGGEMVEALLEDCHTRQPSPAVARSLERPPPAIGNREFARVISMWHNYQSSMLSFFNDFDVLICPANARTAVKLDETEDLSAYTYTSAFNLTGWPSVVIRAGTDEQNLPIGIQILARPFREDHCLGLAAWLQKELGSFAPPPVNALGEP